MTREERQKLREAALAAARAVHARARDTSGRLLGDWELQTSNSHRRIGAHGDGDVLCAVTQRSDNHPDLRAAPDVLRYIVAAQPTVVLTLLDQLDAAERLTDRLGTVEGRLTRMQEIVKGLAGGISKISQVAYEASFDDSPNSLRSAFTQLSSLLESAAQGDPIVTQSQNHRRRLAAFETIGCAIAVLQRLESLDYAWCDDDVKNAIAKARSSLSIAQSKVRDRIDNPVQVGKLRIFALAIETDIGRRTVTLPSPVDVEPIGDVSQVFHLLTESFWKSPAVQGQGPDQQSLAGKGPVKIYALTIETDLGRRTVQLSPPVDVEPFGDMPPKFRSLTEMYWKTICEIATQGPALAAAAPKAEA